MKIADFKKLMSDFTDLNLTSYEPHVSLRCEENDFSFEEVKKVLLDPNANLLRIVEDRPKVYNLYYFFEQEKRIESCCRFIRSEYCEYKDGQSA